MVRQKKEMMLQPLLLSIPEVCESLRLSRAKVYRLIYYEGLPVVHFGRSARESRATARRKPSRRGCRPLQENTIAAGRRSLSFACEAAAKRPRATGRACAPRSWQGGRAEHARAFGPVVNVQAFAWRPKR